MVARGYYLKSKYDLPYTSFIANISAAYIFTYWFGSFFGLVSMYVIYLNGELFNWLVFIVYLSIFAILNYIMIFAPRFSETKYGLLNKFIRVINGWNLIRANKKTILKIGLVSLVKLMFSGITARLYYGAFGLEVFYFEGLFMAITSSFSMLITLTPAGIGINEAFGILSAQIIGIPVTESLPVVLLSRAVSLVSLLSLGPIASFALYKKVFIKTSLNSL